MGKMKDDFWLNMRLLCYLVDVLYGFPIFRICRSIVLLLYPILVHHFGFIKQSILFWAFNVVFIFPFFAMCFLGFLTIVFYYIYYPKRVIYSERTLPTGTGTWRDSTSEYLYLLLGASFWSVLIFCPALSYLLFNSLFMPAIFYAIIFLFVLSIPFAWICLKVFWCTYSSVLILLALYL